MDLLILYGGRYAPVIINPINIKFQSFYKCPSDRYRNRRRNLNSFIELLKGIEPSTSSLPRKCSTPELQQHCNSKFQIQDLKFCICQKPKFNLKLEFYIQSLEF
jgi:hypothetical protein